MENPSSNMILEENTSNEVVDSSPNTKRASKLRDFVNISVKQCVKDCLKIKKKQFKKLLSTEEQSAFNEVYRKTYGNLTNAIMEDIDRLFLEENLTEKLNTLDELTENNKDNSVKWRPTGNPTDDFAPYIHEDLVKYKEVLVDKLEEQKKILGDLKKQIIDGRREIQMKDKMLDQFKEKIDKELIITDLVKSSTDKN